HDVLRSPFPPQSSTESFTSAPPSSFLDSLGRRGTASFGTSLLALSAFRNVDLGRLLSEMRWGRAAAAFLQLGWRKIQRKGNKPPFVFRRSWALANVTIYDVIDGFRSEYSQPAFLPGF